MGSLPKLISRLRCLWSETTVKCCRDREEEKEEADGKGDYVLAAGWAAW